MCWFQIDQQLNGNLKVDIHTYTYKVMHTHTHLHIPTYTNTHINTLTLNQGYGLPQAVVPFLQNQVKQCKLIYPCHCPPPLLPSPPPHTLVSATQHSLPPTGPMSLPSLRIHFAFEPPNWFHFGMGQWVGKWVGALSYGLWTDYFLERDPHWKLELCLTQSAHGFMRYQ